VTTVVVACGGGGLSGGLASWWGTRKRLIVVETEGTGTYAAAKKLSRPTDIDVSGIAADALGGSPYRYPWVGSANFRGC